MAKRKGSRPPPSFMTGHPEFGHVQLYQDMFESPAWGWLSPAARSIYIAMRRLYGPRNGFKESFRCSYTWLSEHANVRRGSIRANLERLVISGFIEIIFWGGRNTPNEYKFLDRWQSIEEKDIPTLSAHIEEFQAKKTEEKVARETQQRKISSLDLGSPSTQLDHTKR